MITAGFDRPRELQMQLFISRGAVAVNAIRGASHRARNPPILLKQVLKSPPLHEYDHIATCNTYSNKSYNLFRPFIDAVRLINSHH